MFTGIVEEKGLIIKSGPSVDGFQMTIGAKIVLEGIGLGDSVAVNGTCLTVTAFGDAQFKVGVSPESLSRTNLGRFKAGDAVNLERALLPTTRLGGHFVQGHVDGLGEIRDIRPEGESLVIRVEADASLMKYIVPKGFICLDGASLTVVTVGPNWFTVMLVAYTREHITLATMQRGYRLNIEVDILGKYVEKLLGQRKQGGTGVDPAFLKEHGFQK